MSEMSAFFVFKTKTTQPLPRSSRLMMHNSADWNENSMDFERKGSLQAVYFKIRQLKLTKNKFVQEFLIVEIFLTVVIFSAIMFSEATTQESHYFLSSCYPSWSYSCKYPFVMFDTQAFVFSYYWVNIHFR